ncbi:MAG: hypothetical protein A4E61_00479 [Syntrophorhabdus sp. PtaB.Bin184]|nr:MAG: hypothetical protein A4E61_00479 [Syntrophorhabdus sp. PtaB.Bin184]
MGSTLDIDDLVADWPGAKAELAELRAEVRRLRDVPQDALDLARSLEGLFFDREAYGSEAYEKKILKASQLISAYRARILDEAAERGVRYVRSLNSEGRDLWDEQDDDRLRAAVRGKE